MSNLTEKLALIVKMRSAREQLDAVVSGLTPEQLTAVGPEGWSIKDHLAHLAAWRRKEIAVMQGRSASEGLGLPPNSYEMEEAEEINDLLLPRHQALSLEQALEEHHAAHADLLEAVQAFPAEKLNQAIPTRSDVTWEQSIAGNSYGHDEEHTPWIQALIKP